jgi:hypothetical protein
MPEESQSTLKTDPTPEETKTPESKPRKLVKRAIKNRPGSGNLIVVKSGEELRQNLQARLDSMKVDFEKIEFDAKKTIESTYKEKTIPYSETKEYREYGALMANWEIREGVGSYHDYRKKMKRLKILIDHFDPEKDYELTVDEAVEILS